MIIFKEKNGTLARVFETKKDYLHYITSRFALYNDIATARNDGDEKEVNKVLKRTKELIDENYEIIEVKREKGKEDG